MSGVQKGVDDWICPDVDCSNINYARRTHCYRCKAERKGARKATSWEKKKLGTEIGKQAAEKSRGLFSAEDWQCTQCPNVNWSRRQSCNMCNAPKFTDSEERTGTAGGYNERMNVEYKEKVPSDEDEFDEFGRRKKKGTVPRKSVSPKKDSDSDEDDDDDDEADLSKYDLWDSDVETGVDKTRENAASGKNPSQPSSGRSKKIERSRSRSRSRSPSCSRYGSSTSRRKRRHSRTPSS